MTTFSSKIVFRAALALVLASALAPMAAVSAEDPKPMTYEQIAKTFKKNPDAKVSLEVVSPEREFFAGDEAVMRFRLKNLSDKKLVIPDWRALDETTNVIIYQMPQKDGVKSFDKSEWAAEVPTIKKERYTPLELNPGNSVLIDKKLEFVAKMGSNRAMPKKSYYVVAELNLKTVEARTAIISIKVK